MLLAFHKPYGVLSRFTDDGSGFRTLSDFGFPPHVYPLGRLDADSEGLLLLCDEPGVNHRLLDPERGHPRLYWVQVEGIPDAAPLQKLAEGVVVQGVPTRPARVERIAPPPIGLRDPPIRVRKTVPDSWISLEIIEGRNRLVRRMTAAVGYPTLRLIRARIGTLSLGPLPAGNWRPLLGEERRLPFAASPTAQPVSGQGYARGTASLRGRPRRATG